MMRARQTDQVYRPSPLHTEAAEFRRLFRFDILSFLRELAGFVFQFLALRLVLGNLHTKFPPLEKIPEPPQLVTVFLKLFSAGPDPFADYQHTEDDTESVDATGAWVQKLRLTTTSLPAGNYRIGFSAELANANKLMRVTRIRTRAGSSSELDLKRAELRMAEARQRGEISRLARIRTQNDLKLLLGLDPDAGLEIDTEIPVVENAEELPGSIEVTPKEREDGRLRFVIPGRIQEGKGQSLLLEALPELKEFAQIYLLGAGKDGEAFFGKSGVNVIIQYRREHLRELLAKIGPHVAGLLSIVPETFSYTLSEMQQLNIPVIATRVGSLEERIMTQPDCLKKMGPLACRSAILFSAAALRRAGSRSAACVS